LIFRPLLLIIAFHLRPPLRHARDAVSIISSVRRLATHYFAIAS